LKRLLSSVKDRDSEIEKGQTKRVCSKIRKSWRGPCSHHTESEQPSLKRIREVKRLRREEKGVISRRRDPRRRELRIWLTGMIAPRLRKKNFWPRTRIKDGSPRAQEVSPVAARGRVKMKVLGKGSCFRTWAGRKGRAWCCTRLRLGKRIQCPRLVRGNGETRVGVRGPGRWREAKHLPMKASHSKKKINRAGQERRPDAGRSNVKEMRKILIKRGSRRKPVMCRLDPRWLAERKGKARIQMHIPLDQSIIGNKKPLGYNDQARCVRRGICHLK